MSQGDASTVTSRPAYFAVLCTTPDVETATALADKLVRARLSACVNVVPGLTSVYWWNNAVHHDAEALLIAKTDGAHLRELIDAIVLHHPYDNPEAIALEVADGAERYLQWISDSIEP